MPELPPCSLRIVEPNLAGNSGHYAEFVGAVAARSHGVFDRLQVFADRRAGGVLAEQPLVQMHTVFGRGAGEPPTGPSEGRPAQRAVERPAQRPARRSEASVIRDSLDSGDPFLVLTAHASHAPMLAWMARGTAAPKLRNARLYFHWRERRLLDRAMMRASPRVREHAVAIAPTEPTASYLRSQGWKRVANVAYPMLAPTLVPGAQPFRHLLVAGAARVNKGLDLVVGLAETLGRRGDETPLLVQTTPKRRSGRRGSREEVLLAQLAASGARGLHASDEAPSTAAYGERFAGALVLAPYDPEHFADNVSGVVLDALLRGAPVIASAGSWPGRMVERFGAGALLHERTAAGLDAAVQQVLADWDTACARAQEAARVLAAEHDPAQLVRVLREGV